MPLVLATLADALEKIFTHRPGDAGPAWAAAYRSYAGNALAGATAPAALSLEAAENVLGQALGTVFKAGAGGGRVEPDLDRAFVAFWFTPPVAFVAPPAGPPAIAGLVTLAPAGVLGPGFAAVFASGVSGRASAGVQARAVAGVLDGWTRTVVVTNTPVTPPGPPVQAPLT